MTETEPQVGYFFDPATLDPNALTGVEVRRVREAYKLSKREFAELCGIMGKSPARLTNIEGNDSWKEGDREKVAEGLRRLAANPPKGKHGRQRGETGAERAARLDAKLRERGTHVDSGATAVISGDEESDDESLLVPSIDQDVGVELTDELVNQLADEAEDDYHLAQFDPVTSTDDALSLTPNERLRALAGVARLDGHKVLTNTEVSVWQRCRRKWWLGVYRQLALKVQDFTGPRSTGHRVHRALAAWYVPEGQERTDPREALERAIVEDWTAIVNQERQRPSYVDDEQSLGQLTVSFNAATTLERAMVEGYVEWLAERGDDANLLVTAPETPIDALIEEDVMGEKVSFRALALLDLRLTRASDGVRLFVDHKTVGNFAARRKTLHMDPQMLHYHLLEWLNTPEGEKRCDGALYNMLRRTQRTARAKPPFYERVEVHHNAFELDAYRRRLVGAARDIMRTERELAAGADHMVVAYPNPTEACSWDCDFFAVCPMFDDGSRVEDALTALYKKQDPLERYDRSRNEEGA